MPHRESVYQEAVSYMYTVHVYLYYTSIQWPVSHNIYLPNNITLYYINSESGYFIHIMSEDAICTKAHTMYTVHVCITGNFVCENFRKLMKIYCFAEKPFMDFQLEMWAGPYYMY